MQVVERMKTKLVVASPTDSVAAAWRLLRQHQIRHLPVVEEGKLVGIVTDRDIRLVFPSALTSGSREQDPHDALEKVAVREIMTGQVVTVAPEASIANVARLLLERRIGGLPVVQGSRLVGIITKTDILAAFVDVVEGESQ
ncbi:MAG: CBS domain-containing protein [candidate division NC10 bacterium]|nr:CBS domain-containing protein [candidate division NC10 bacterium]